jgi:sodium transport system permease protein
MHPIRIVFQKEALDSLRDRRTLISMIVVPVLIMPLLTLGMGVVMAKTVQKVRRETPRVMLLGGADSPKLMAALKELKGIAIVPERRDYTNEISEKRIQAAAEIPTGFDLALARGEPTQVRIYGYEGEMKSMFASQTLDQFFRNLRENTVRERLASRNLPASLLRPFEIERRNVASPKKVAGNLLGGLLPYMVIILCMAGATYPAMDLTAGEKERGTIETILCSPVSRTHLVLGKFLTVLLTSMASATLALASMGFSFGLARNLFADSAEDLSTRLLLSVGLSDVLAVVVLIVPLAVLFSAAQLSIALFAKTYKEAQSYVTPLMFVVILPAVVSMAPGLELNLKLALVPILNTSLVSKEIMSGTYHWHYIGLIFLSSCLYAGLALAWAVKLFQREEVLFRM